MISILLKKSIILKPACYLQYSVPFDVLCPFEMNELFSFHLLLPSLPPQWNLSYQLPQFCILMFVLVCLRNLFWELLFHSVSYLLTFSAEWSSIWYRFHQLYLSKDDVLMRMHFSNFSFLSPNATWGFFESHHSHFYN